MGINQKALFDDPPKLYEQELESNSCSFFFKES